LELPESRPAAPIVVVHTVRGHDALAGYDEASGLGTIDAAAFIPQLVVAAGG
jgi:hypothetical protein